MTTVDLTKYLGEEAETFRQARRIMMSCQRKMLIVKADIVETIKKNLKQGDIVRVRREGVTKPRNYTFEFIDQSAFIVVSTDYGFRKVINVFSEDGEVFPGYSEIYILGKKIKLK